MTIRRAETQAEREQPNAVTLIRSADGKRLCKTYFRGLPERPYDNAFLHTSTTWTFETIEDLADMLPAAAAAVHRDIAAIRGAIRSGFNENEPHVRRIKDRGDVYGAPYHDVPRNWFMADIDSANIEGWSVFKDPGGTISHVLQSRLPPALQDVDCIVQLSSSAGLIDKKSADWRFGDGPTIGLHVFFLLDHPVTELRLREALKLWGLDSHLAGAVQPHYIANPLFLKQKGFLDPEPIEDKLKQRWLLIKGRRSAVRISDLPATPPAEVRAKTKRSGATTVPTRQPAAKVEPNRRKTSSKRGRRDLRGQLFEQLLATIGEGGHHFEAAKTAVHHATMKLPDHEWPQRRQRIFDRLDATAAPDQYKSDLDRYRNWCVNVRDSEQRWQDDIPEPSLDRGFDQQMVDDARERLSENFRRWFNAANELSAFFGEAQSPLFNALCLSSPGLGKTTAVLKVAARREFSLDFYVASHRDAEERQKQLAEFPAHRAATVMVEGMELKIDSLLQRPLSIIERGRAAEDPKHRLKASPLMCGRTEAFSAVLAAGVDAPRKLMCEPCPMRGDCGAYAQLEEIKEVQSGRGVVISSHAYTIKQRRHDDGDAAVIDENATSQHWQRERGPKLESIDPKVAKALTSDKPTLSLVRRLGGRAKAASYLRSLRQKQPRPEREELCGSMTDDKIIDATREATARTELRRLFTALLKAVEAGWTTADHIEIDNGRLWIHIFAESRLDPETPLLILDATARPELIQAVYRRKFEVIDEQLPERLDITQVSTTGSKAALYQWSDDGDLADMAAQLARFANGKPCLVIVHKSHRGKWVKALPDNFRLAHFGNLRGTNDFAEFDRAVIIGRQQPPPVVFIRQAAALRLARGEPQLPPPPADLRQAPSGYFFHPDIGRDFHPDPIVEALRWSACEGEIIQAVGRLRSSVQPTRKSLLLVTDLSIPGLTPARAIPLSRLRTAKPDLMRAAVNFMLNTVGGLVMTRKSFERHTGITSKSYRREAFDAVRDRCVEISYVKAYGQCRPNKALVLRERAAEAQEIIERIEGHQVIFKGSISGGSAPKRAA